MKINNPQACLHLFRERSNDPHNDLPLIDENEAVDEKELDPERYILCRQCQQAVTSKDERIFRDGSHRHTFANPNGLVFDIACFRNAMGCGYAGPYSDEFTWFKGYSWRVAICGLCLNHLGWLFVSQSGDNFHGLIVNQLIE